MHDGHRERMKKRCQINGIESLANHEILELSLFYAIPRKNTNGIAHKLLEKFGSISAIFDAPINILKEVDGIGDNAALFIKLIPELARIYMEDKHKFEEKNISPEQVCEKLLHKFIGRNEEVVAIALFDAKGKLVYDGIVSKGTVNAVNLYIRKILEFVMNYNACSIIVAHNHPTGLALPSLDDIEATQMLVNILKGMKVTLIDHIIIADNEYISLRHSGVCEF